MGWFFIPIANLFKPYQVTQEIWKASDPRSDIHDALGWKRNKRSALVGFWWTFWIIGNILSNIVARTTLNPNISLQDYKGMLYLGMVADVFTFLAGLCVIFVIYKVQKRQEEKYQKLITGIDETW